MSIIYQYGEDKQDRVAIDWIVKYVKQKYFKSMRTEKQLGYIVFFTKIYQRGVYGVNFLIQSGVQSPQYCINETDTFITELVAGLDTLDQSEFEEIRQGLISNYSQKDTSYWKLHNRAVSLLAKNSDEFAISENKVQEAGDLKIEDVVRVMRSLFVSGRKRLEICLTCEKQVEQDSTLIQERKTASDVGEYVKVLEVDWLKKNLPFYPDYFAKL